MTLNFILATGDKNPLKFDATARRYAIAKHPEESDRDYVKRVKEHYKIKEIKRND